MVVEGVAQIAAEIYDVESDVLDRLWELFREPRSLYFNNAVSIPGFEGARGSITFNEMTMETAATLCAQVAGSIQADPFGDFGDADYRRALTEIAILLSHS